MEGGGGEAMRSNEHRVFFFVRGHPGLGAALFHFATALRSPDTPPTSPAPPDPRARQAPVRQGGARTASNGRVKSR